MEIPRLHPDTIDAVKARADIYEVVSEHVVLRKRGKDYIGVCPFHDEKTPSFSVSPSKQMYYCFGCQAGGNAIKFLMDIQKRGFADVVLDLARRYQVPLQTLAPEERQELQRQISLREQLYEVVAAAARFYQHALRKEGYGAMSYLQQQRQLDEEIIQRFGLGYAPGGWETLYRYLVEDKHYPVQLVEKAGLIKPRSEGKGYYDVFRDRIIIPIHDTLGRVIGFGGRTMGDDQPKYLNSPETEIFFKGKTLFGLDQAKNPISLFDRVIVVEGYFDVIALHAAGITNAVASLGTALSLEQVKLALRYCDSKQLILNFDADKAGVNATERAIGEIANLAYNGEVQLKILNIPDGKDADEYLRTYSADDYRQLLNQAPLWIDWQIHQIIRERDIKNVIDFQFISQQFVKLLNKIENIDTRNYYISHCAEILCGGDTNLIALRIENLVTQLNPLQRSFPKRKYSKPTPTEFTTPADSIPLDDDIGIDSPSSTQDLGTDSSKNQLTISKSNLLVQAEELLLRIYLHCPQHRPTINQILEEKDLQFSLSHHRYLWQQILQIPHHEQIDLISTIQNIYLASAIDLNSISHLFYLSEKAKTEIIRTPQVIQATIACMEKNLREKRKRHFLELLNQTDPNNDPELSQSYYQSFLYEEIKLQELNKMRQFSILDLI
ncbi:DNA primase [Calothrix sp. NIES-3974]|uniref:DNA primase n=1 Tax=Calothrix sp. NIES-3974 TaxID=2005462 RepID=UPI000B5F47F9|nr:DNA primase [Calothrix sp. NIES-3974]BAZ06840.1 DNA primase [Calothrix sp. NIES-3974]